MKKNILKLFIVFNCVLVLATSVKAGITVDPTVHDFGDVEVGSSSTTIVTITNNWWGNLSINIISITQSGSDFSIISAPSSGTVISQNCSENIEIDFSPNAEGCVTATLVITWSNGEAGTSYVELSGTGVGQEEPPTSVADILAFIDESVADGTLVGYGPGKSSDGRLRALRNMIEASGDLIDDGFVEEACQQLIDVYYRCDGLDQPPEFVAGPAASILANMILDHIDCLSC